MELELGLRFTRARESLTSGVQISKKYGGPLFTSTETETMFILVGHLPGFKKDDIQINIDESGTDIAISGQTCVQEMAMVRWRLQVKEPIVRHFRKVFKIPHVVILDEIKAWFQDEEPSLTIFMPKSIKGIQGIRVDEVKQEQAEQEENASTEKAQDHGAQTSDTNEGNQTQVDETLPTIDSTADSGVGETSDSSPFVPLGEAGQQEETVENSNGQTSEKNNRVKPYVDEAKETSQKARPETNDGLHPAIDPERKTGEDETSEMNGSHTEEDQTKETSKDGKLEMNDRFYSESDMQKDPSEGETSNGDHTLHSNSDMQKEPSEGERSDGNPILRSEVDQTAEQDQEILNPMNIEPAPLHQLASPYEKDDRYAGHEIANPDAMEALQHPEESSFSENPDIDVPPPAYGTQEKPKKFEEDKLDGATAHLLSTDQNEEDGKPRAETAESLDSGRTPNDQDMVTSVRGEKKKRKRYSRPYTVIAGSAFLVSLIVLTVHLHRSKKQN